MCRAAKACAISGGSTARNWSLRESWPTRIASASVLVLKHRGSVKDKTGVGMITSESRV